MRLATKLVTTLGILGVSAIFYATERSMEHFLWHVGYGAAAGISLAALIRQSPFVGGLLGYAYMVVPDVLWLVDKMVTGAPSPHKPWMDVFLFHYSLDKWSLATPLVLPAYIGAMALAGWRAGTLMKASKVATA